MEITQDITANTPAIQSKTVINDKPVHEMTHEEFTEWVRLDNQKKISNNSRESAEAMKVKQDPKAIAERAREKAEKMANRFRGN